MKLARQVTFWLIVLIQVLAGLIAGSVFFVEEEDRFESDANVLISTFGVGMAVFGLAITWFGLRSGQAWAWAALWAWPVFFIAHVAALGTFAPDLVFALIFVLALLLHRPEALARRAT